MPFGLNVRADFAYESAHIGLGKNHDGIDIRKRRQNLCPFICGHHWPARAFQTANRIIGVDCDDQPSAEFFRRSKIADVSDMEHVEAAVGKRDLLA